MFSPKTLDEMVYFFPITSGVDGSVCAQRNVHTKKNNVFIPFPIVDSKNNMNYIEMDYKK